MELPEDIGLEEWSAIGEQLREVERSLMWWLGDWLRFGERRYGETYAQAASQTGFSEQTLMNAKWVAERYEISARAEELSFYHHQAAASLPTLERADVLRSAIDNGWSVATLREEVRHRKLAKPATGSPTGGCVLDPFGGAGTTGLVAERLGRDATLIELNPRFGRIADRRLRAGLAQVDGPAAPLDDPGPLFSSEAA